VTTAHGRQRVGDSGGGGQVAAAAGGRTTVGRWARLANVGACE
jgi:hypothetical protein